MNSTNANPNNIPILGEYSFIYWTNFTSSNSLPSLEKKLEEVHLVPATGDSKHGTSNSELSRTPNV